jgi:BMFP domain-containing protein YqiC
MSNEIHFDTKEQVTHIDGALFSSIRTAFSVKEIALKVLTNKFSSDQQGTTTVNALASHIYNSCSVYQELGHPDAAKVSQSNLRQVFKKSKLSDHSSGNLPLMLHLEDTNNMKSQSNLNGAITYCKLIATHLNSARNDSVDIERDQICAEALLLGGLWMAQHNVDAAESILSYFEKASELAMQIHEKAPSDSSVHRASLASFKLGEFAANLFNSVDARVKSEAFKRRVAVAIERKKELQALTAQLTQLQKKSRASNEAATHEARIIHITLSREVEMEDRELSSIEKSTQRYLQLAVESYCSALKLCPTTITANVAKHVFQLVS